MHKIKGVHNLGTEKPGDLGLHRKKNKVDLVNWDFRNIENRVKYLTILKIHLASYIFQNISLKKSINHEFRTLIVSKLEKQCVFASKWLFIDINFDENWFNFYSNHFIIVYRIERTVLLSNHFTQNILHYTNSWILSSLPDLNLLMRSKDDSTHNM